MKFIFIALGLLFVSCVTRGPGKVVRESDPRTESTVLVANDAKVSAVPFGYFSNYSFDGEHASGANLWIWKTSEGKFVGLFAYHEGDPEIYGSVRELNSVVVDERTGQMNFSFDAISYDRNRTEIRTPLMFKGRIFGKQLSGQLTGYSDPIKLKLKKIPNENAGPFFKTYCCLDELRKNSPPHKTEF